MTYTEDPIANAIFSGINKGIRVAVKNECYGSAVVLILSGIDTMAFLGMPANQQDVAKNDFVAWVDRYIRFPCREQVTGLDLYGARCGMLHSFSTISSLHRKGKCRQIGYMSRSVPEVRFVPEVSRDLVLVSVPALATAFFAGVNQFLIDLYSNKARGEVADRRFQYVVHTLSMESPSDQAENANIFIERGVHSPHSSP